MVHCHFYLILLANANKILYGKIFHKDIWKKSRLLTNDMDKEGENLES